MKLYIWKGVLCDYTCGMIAATAENVKDARAIVIEQARKQHESDYVVGRLMAGTKGTPKVFRSPGAAWVSGGG